MEMGALAAIAGCVGMKCGQNVKLAMNASTLRGYNLSLLDQVKAVAAAGFKGFEPWMKDIRAAKDDGTFREVLKVAADGGLSFINGIAFGQWVNPDPAVRAAGLEETKRDMAMLA